LDPEPGLWLQWDYGDGPVIDGRKTVLFCAWLAWSHLEDWRLVAALWQLTSQQTVTDTTEVHPRPGLPPPDGPTKPRHGTGPAGPADPPEPQAAQHPPVRPAGSSAVSGSCDHTGAARPTDPDARCARRSSSPSTSKDPSTSRCGSATPSRSGTRSKSVDGTALYAAAEPGPWRVRLRRLVVSCRCLGVGAADGARSGYRRDRVP
jgi:hypothetical protein